MKVSDPGLMALICREGIALGWYYDSVKVATIGIGHTAMAGPPEPKQAGVLTVRQAFDLFHKDIEKYAETVRKTIKRPMEQHEFDAFVSICYNIGQGGFAKSTFVKRFNAGDRAGCAQAIMFWKKPAEIIGRRKQERDQFLGQKQTKYIATLYQPGRNGRLGKASSVDLVRELQISSARPTAQPKPPAKPEPVQPAPQKPADERQVNGVGIGVAAGVTALLAAAAAKWTELTTWIGGIFS